MMPLTVVYSSLGPQAPIALDYQPQSEITVVVKVLIPFPTDMLVEVTLDNVFDQDDPNYVAAASATWLTVPGAPTTDTGFVTFSGPWRAIRLNILDGISVQFSVAQAVAGDY